MAAAASLAVVVGGLARVVRTPTGIKTIVTGSDVQWWQAGVMTPSVWRQPEEISENVLAT